MQHRYRSKSISLQLGAFLLLVSILTIIAVVLYRAIPHEKRLIFFAMYAVPSHFLISFFPIEPALLYVSKFYRPWVVTGTALAGGGIASILDFLLLVPLLNHKKVRSRFEDKQLYQKSIYYFKKWPFGVLTLANMLPIPFYPFKFLSFTSHYPFWRYEASLIMGRAPRYFLMAILGYALNLPTWSILVLASLFMLPMIIKKLHSYFAGRRKNQVEVQESSYIEQS